MADREIRAALDRHWAASDANEFEVSTRSIGRTRCSNIRNRASALADGEIFRPLAPRSRTKKRSIVRRIVGAGDLWVAELLLTYDGRPSYTVSMMEFRGGKVARETQYFSDPFEPGPSRAFG